MITEKSYYTIFIIGSRNAQITGFSLRVSGINGKNSVMGFFSDHVMTEIRENRGCPTSLQQLILSVPVFPRKKLSSNGYYL
jgi:hypothetical protein